MSILIMKTSTLYIFSQTTVGAHYTLYGHPADTAGVLIEVTVYKDPTGGYYNIYNTTTPTDLKVSLCGGSPDAYANILNWCNNGATEHLLAYESANPLAPNVFRVLSYGLLNPTDPYAALQTVSLTHWEDTDVTRSITQPRRTNGDGLIRADMATQ